jgi:hypothetical protein
MPLCGDFRVRRGQLLRVIIAGNVLQIGTVANRVAMKYHAMREGNLDSHFIKAAFDAP